MDNINKVKVIELGGEKYLMRFTMLSMALLERRGVKVKEIGEDMSMDNMLTVIWSTLHPQHPELTVDMVGALIDFSEFEKVASAVTELMGGTSEKN